MEGERQKCEENKWDEKKKKKKKSTYCCASAQPYRLGLQSEKVTTKSDDYGHHPPSFAWLGDDTLRTRTTMQETVRHGCSMVLLLPLLCAHTINTILLFIRRFIRPELTRLLGSYYGGPSK